MALNKVKSGVKTPSYIRSSMPNFPSTGAQVWVPHSWTVIIKEF